MLEPATTEAAVTMRVTSRVLVKVGSGDAAPRRPRLKLTVGSVVSTSMESLTLSHGLQMGDALIAATALDGRMRLLTGNIKHFSAVGGLQLEAFSA